MKHETTACENYTNELCTDIRSVYYDIRIDDTLFMIK